MVSISDFGFSVDVGAFVDNALMIIYVVIIGAVFLGLGYFAYRQRKKRGKTSDKKIGWWEEHNENLVPGAMDNAREVLVSGTKLRLFYIKAKDMWLPRFALGVTPDLFYVCITPKRELVNFKLKSIEADMKSAGLKYDHTDMIWASENLREFVKRNYRDKAVPWWQLYMQPITTVIYVVILTISFAVILYYMRKLLGDIGGVMSQAEQVIKTACSNQASGITPAG